MTKATTISLGGGGLCSGYIPVLVILVGIDHNYIVCTCEWRAKSYLTLGVLSICEWKGLLSDTVVIPMKLSC